MNSDELLQPLAAPLRDLVGWLDERAEPYAIIGGVAAAILGKTRFTADIDAVILTDESKLADFLDDAKAHGFTSRRSDPIGFARANRILLLVHEADAVNLDLSLGALVFEREMIGRAKRIRVLGMEIPVAAPEELIAMKALAFRDRDIRDIESVLAANPDIDMARVRHWVQLLAEALETPEIMERFENLSAVRRFSPEHTRRRRNAD